MRSGWYGQFEVGVVEYGLGVPGASVERVVGRRGGWDEIWGEQRPCGDRKGGQGGGGG